MLVLQAGTKQRVLHAHDATSGAALPEFRLPAGLHAGPVSYKLRTDRKQFLVVAPGAHQRMGSKLGDYIIAYTLP